MLPRMPRRVYAASADIDAPPELVWSVLVDLERYPEWNPFTIAARSTLREGAPVDMRVRMSRLDRVLSQREHVREVVPNRRLRWGMKILAPSILSGERDQRLEPLSDGRTRYVTEDVISGLLAPLVSAIFGPSIQAGFTAMAEALAREAEKRDARR